MNDKRNILYISNTPTPYRVEYFNQLSEKINLTVLYERKKSSNRNAEWANSVKSNYSVFYLNGIKIFKEYTIDIGIIKYIFSKKFNEIIVGCFNSPSQLLAIFLMKLFRKKYILNLDGEYFFDGTGIKKIIKRKILKGADKYFVAGEKAKENLIKYIPNKKVYVYHFSSLTKLEIDKNKKYKNKNINNKVLVVGQYFDYKGLDVALECAKIDQSINYKFIGSGNRSTLLTNKIREMKLKNVEVVPFLQKEALYKEFQTCKCLLLPSKKECWGLVINEAASFGCPIISTLGSGAAKEILDEKWIVNVDNSQEIYKKIKIISDKEYNKKALIEKNKNYFIERNVDETIKMINA